MTHNIHSFLKAHNDKMKGLQPHPIVVRWLQWPRMIQSLEIIDKHISYLLHHGAIAKLNQWFLAGDENFNSITAERYILAYLRQRNDTLEDNLTAEGIDGFLDDEFGRIGVEITTLNGFIGDWIFVERLTEFLDEQNYLTMNSGLEISYSHARIQLAAQGKLIYDFVRKTGEAILSNDTQALSEMKISVHPHNRGPSISFDIDDTDSFPWFRYIYLLNDFRRSAAEQYVHRTALSPHQTAALGKSCKSAPPVTHAVRQNKMFRDWKSLTIGLLAGVILTSAASYMLSARYKVSSSGPQGIIVIRTDSWTGKSWMARYYEKDGGKNWYWEPMEERR